MARAVSTALLRGVVAELDDKDSCVIVGASPLQFRDDLVAGLRGVGGRIREVKVTTTAEKGGKRA